MAKAAVMVSWTDVPHLSAAQQASILASTPSWQRASRSKGIPDLGPGAIFQVPEADISVEPFEIPKYWPRAYGMDVGWNRTAVAWFAHDREAGVWYQYAEYYRGQAEPSIHALAIKARGEWIPGVIDPAARGRNQKDGTQLLTDYQEAGLDIEVANNALESGLAEVWEAYSFGRMKVFSSCRNTFSEYRVYRRDKHGKVVKKNDHLMSAIRYFWMSGRERAIVQPADDPGGTPWYHWTPPAVWSG